MTNDDGKSIEITEHVDLLTCPNKRDWKNCGFYALCIYLSGLFLTAVLYEATNWINLGDDKIPRMVVFMFFYPLPFGCAIFFLSCICMMILLECRRRRTQETPLITPADV